MSILVFLTRLPFSLLTELAASRLQIQIIGAGSFKAKGKMLLIKGCRWCCLGHSCLGMGGDYSDSSVKAAGKTIWIAVSRLVARLLT